MRTLATNLTNEALQAKLDKAVEEYNTIEANLRQGREQVETLEKGLEQQRGRVIMLDELLKEQQASNGEVQEPEVVTGEVLEGTATEKK
jgi:hypothetical protein